ncbi:MAG: flavodoxin family protein [Nocardioides sp.]|jgi:NAD(P)H-dependent FMN reductase
MTPTVLVVHHTVSPALAELVEAVVAGIRHPDLEGAVRANVRPALSTTGADVLAASAYALITPVNIGYMSGALKHFFDTVYYPCLTATVRRPYALVVHGNNDVAGGVRSVESIAGGLEWARVIAPVEVVGDVSAQAREACAELGGTLAATIME